jgi:hypothetical protein
MISRASILTARVALLYPLLALTLGACASHAARCDGALQPINAPAPAEHRPPGASSERDAGAS